LDILPWPKRWRARQLSVLTTKLPEYLACGLPLAMIPCFPGFSIMRLIRGGLFRPDISCQRTNHLVLRGWSCAPREEVAAKAERSRPWPISDSIRHARAIRAILHGSSGFTQARGGDNRPLRSIPDCLRTQIFPLRVCGCKTSQGPIRESV